MTAAENQERVTVPLKVEGVVVGKIEIDEQNNLSAQIVYKGTESYFKEMLLLNMIESISVVVDYVELPPDHVPAWGHLRLVKEL